MGSIADRLLMATHKTQPSINDIVNFTGDNGLSENESWMVKKISRRNTTGAVLIYPHREKQYSTGW